MRALLRVVPTSFATALGVLGRRCPPVGMQISVPWGAVAVLSCTKGIKGLKKAGILPKTPAVRFSSTLTLPQIPAMPRLQTLIARAQRAPQIQDGERRRYRPRCHHPPCGVRMGPTGATAAQGLQEGQGTRAGTWQPPATGGTRPKCPHGSPRMGAAAGGVRGAGISS